MDSKAIEHLRCAAHYRQIDDDGVQIGVSRQAVEESVADYDALAARLAEAERLLRRYYVETPLGHQPHMIAHEAAAWLKGTADSASPAQRPHIASADCWCKPRVEYVNPETGVTHYVHHEPN